MRHCTAITLKTLAFVVGLPCAAVFALNSHHWVNANQATKQSTSDSTVLIAQTSRPSKRSEGDRWLKDLNLTKDQIQKIQVIRQRYQPRMNQQRQAVARTQQELKQLMASSASSEQIRRKFDQLQKLRQQFSDTRMEIMLAIRELLNPQQREKLANLMRQFGRMNRDALR